MVYYEFLPATKRFHGLKGLVYAADTELKIGSLAVIDLKGEPVAGIVVKKVNKPGFKVKSVNNILPITTLPESSLKLLNWLIGYYPAPLGAIAAQFLPGGLTEATKPNHKLDEVKSMKANLKVLPSLTEEQTAVLMKIRQGDGQHSFVLHGETGSGKTRIYIELAREALELDSDALILTPEIGLTPQLVKDFSQSFGSNIMVMHSNLTPKQRRLAWYSVLSRTRPVLVIGARSALFAPFKKLGLVVMDESHDTAYKQEQAPYYQSIRVAAQLAKLHSARFVLGSATPNVADYFVAKAKKIPLLRLQKLAIKSPHASTTIKVIDLRDKSLFSKSSFISDTLLRALEQTISNKEQALIFLNRRGTARVVMCQNCGWQLLCPNCDLPLTYHGDNHTTYCHTCGFRQKAPSQCPICSSIDITYKSAGTKAVVDNLQLLLPKARIQRFDTDNKKSERFEQHYQKLSSGQVDIIVGTQLITKGLDLPKLSLVGVLVADSGLSFPDYTAEERTFQQLSQILGRVGRGHRAGTAIIQTYQPGSSLINAVITKDWHYFYDQQLSERQKFLFPPYCYLLKLSCKRKTIKAAQAAAGDLANNLKRLPNIRIIGPAPSFYEKSKQGFSWQLIIKAKDRKKLTDIIKRLPHGWSYDIDPSSLL